MWKYIKKKIKKPEMVLTVQTQVTCLISESKNPSLPNTSSSKTTELYGLLYGENVIVLLTAHKTL